MRLTLGQSFRRWVADFVQLVLKKARFKKSKEKKMRKRFALAVSVLVCLSFLLACAAPAPTAVPTRPAAAPAAATTAPPPAAATAPPAATKPVAAAPTAAPAVKVKRGGVLRIGINSTWDHLDPQISIANGEHAIWMYDAFFMPRYDEQKKEILFDPTLAESFERTGPSALVYKVRKGVKFHDGSDFNGKVAKWNLDRMVQHPKTKKEDTLSIASVDLIDDYTIRLNLKSPSSSSLINAMLANPASNGILPQQAVEKLGDDAFSQKPAGSGPFQFAEWVPGDHLNLKRWDSYWQKGADGQLLPYMEGINIRFIQDENVRYIELKTGNIDITSSSPAIPDKDVPAVKSSTNLVQYELPWGGGCRMLALNPVRGPFTGNLKFRQAAMYAIDRAAMTKVLMPNIGFVHPYLWSPLHLGFDKSVPVYNFDPAKSKQLLIEAGYPNGVDNSLLFISRALDAQMAQIVKQMLDQVGIRTAIDGMERTAWVQKGRNGDLPSAVYNHAFERETDLNNRDFGGQGSLNYMGFGDRQGEFDKCMEEGRSIEDLAKRAEVYKRCQQMIFETATYSCMFGYPNTTVSQTYVKGIALAFNSINNTSVWLDK
jgi:peptide/nickel transport system substrate-binding protein